MTAEKFKRVKVLLLDVDGVLTGGEIVYDENGKELKAFNVKDGLGIKLLQSAGIPVGIVTSRSSGALYHRCRNLGISEVYDGIQDKASVLAQIRTRLNVTAEEIAFMGDDLPDLPIMAKVGFSIAVADAAEMVRTRADFVTQKAGGKGAVREVCELILHHQQLWDRVQHVFTGGQAVCEPREK